MLTHPREVMIGVASGAAIALSFAVAFQPVPNEAFTQGPWLVVFYLIAVAVAPPTVGLVRWVARRVRADQQHTMMWAIAGGLTFDGLAMGFAGAVYGHDGAALQAEAALLLWAFAGVLAAALVMPVRHRVTEAVSSAAS